MIKRIFKANVNTNIAELSSYVINDEYMVFAKNLEEAVAMYNKFNNSLDLDDEDFNINGVYSVYYVPINDFTNA